MLVLAIVWVFAVDVQEIWYRYDKSPRNVGGWTYHGPYQTRQSCEKARGLMMQRAVYSGEAHTVWHIPRECRQEDGDKVKALLEAELQLMRRGR